MSNWRIENMESEQGPVELLQQDVVTLGGVVNKHADIIEDMVQINTNVVEDIVREVNLVWSVLELPWYRRLRRLNRAWALDRAVVKEAKDG